MPPRAGFMRISGGAAASRNRYAMTPAAARTSPALTPVSAVTTGC